MCRLKMRPNIVTGLVNDDEDYNIDYDFRNIAIVD